ncbi:MAG: hypothetical protein KatS3mg118_0768 [Paracoccaceae bacterium]|nr:MAG: hypothetical protein D6686_12870 [Alphaproteobacteria bacterium]GIX12809.1 MAG: hypothetical protein KatS3mg118_0768 [Paracoccaceae bacterium]
MRARPIPTVALLAAWLGALAAGAGMAETRVDAKADWSIFRSDGGERQCWIVSAPTGWKALRGRNDVTSSVRRGDILLMVAVRPAEGVKNEVSYTSGYPFRKDSKVTVEIGNDKFEMFTEGEWAWTPSPADDDRLVEAMKRGITAVVTGVSSRGTQTIDTFGLRGFTAALTKAQELCR